jgi:predicted RNA methylase
MSLKDYEPVEIYNFDYRSLFPPKNNVDMKKLRMTDIGLYSITPFRQANEITNEIIKRIDKNPEEIIITDANGCMGGNTISFAQVFGKVYSIEKNHLHYNILVNNVKTYGLDNVQVICGNFEDIYSTINSDVIFMDPPWGGQDYYKVKNLALYYGTYKVENIIKEHLNAKLYVVKIPMNFNMASFVNTLGQKDYKIEICVMKKYQIVYVTKLL